MRRIAHISDLHFNRVEPPVVEGLLRDLEAFEPTLVVISGDLTQRARRREYRAARAFLQRLPSPWLAVPGNHDIAPMYRPFHRSLTPFRRFRKYISADLEPFWQDERLAVLGLNTAQPFRIKEGRISSRQVATLRERFRPLPEDRFRVVCTHHPFLPPADLPKGSVVGEARRALRALDQCGVELLLAGHLHKGFAQDASSHHEWIRRSILVVQAATATSTRLRDEPNGYNQIVIDPPHLSVEVRSWGTGAFRREDISRFRKQGDRWLPQPAVPAATIAVAAGPFAR